MYCNWWTCIKTFSEQGAFVITALLLPLANIDLHSNYKHIHTVESCAQLYKVSHMPWPWICTSGSADFTLLESEVVIPYTTVQGQVVCVANVSILGDDIVEGNETFQLMIQPANPLDMVSMGRNTTTVTIVDDDGKHQILTQILFHQLE